MLVRKTTARNKIIDVCVFCRYALLDVPPSSQGRLYCFCTVIVCGVSIHHRLTKDIQDADEGALRVCIRVAADRSFVVVDTHPPENYVDLPVDPREELPVDVLHQCGQVFLGL